MRKYETSRRLNRRDINGAIVGANRSEPRGERARKRVTFVFAVFRDIPTVFPFAPSKRRSSGINYTCQRGMFTTRAQYLCYRAGINVMKPIINPNRRKVRYTIRKEDERG